MNELFDYDEIRNLSDSKSVLTQTSVNFSHGLGVLIMTFRTHNCNEYRSLDLHGYLLLTRYRLIESSDGSVYLVNGDFQ